MVPGEECIPARPEPDHAQDPRDPFCIPRGLQEGYRGDTRHCRPVCFVAHEAALVRRDHHHQNIRERCPLPFLSRGCGDLQEVPCGGCSARRRARRPGMNRRRILRKNLTGCEHAGWFFPVNSQMRNPVKLLLMASSSFSGKGEY
jgi:hypothetical protein